MYTYIGVFVFVMVHFISNINKKIFQTKYVRR